MKAFHPITTAVNKDNKSFQFSSVPHTRFPMVFRLRRDFVERKIVDQLKINIQLPEVLVDFAD